MTTRIDDVDGLMIALDRLRNRMRVLTIVVAVLVVVVLASFLQIIHPSNIRASSVVADTVTAETSSGSATLGGVSLLTVSYPDGKTSIDSTGVTMTSGRGIASLNLHGLDVYPKGPGLGESFKHGFDQENPGLWMEDQAGALRLALVIRHKFKGPALVMFPQHPVGDEEAPIFLAERNDPVFVMRNARGNHPELSLVVLRPYAMGSYGIPYLKLGGSRDSTCVRSDGVFRDTTFVC